jgi:hypothetical protein
LVVHVCQVPSEKDCAECRTALSDGKQYGVKDAAKALKAAGLPVENTLGK